MRAAKDTASRQRCRGDQLESIARQASSAVKACSRPSSGSITAYSDIPGSICTANSRSRQAVLILALILRRESGGWGVINHSTPPALKHKEQGAAQRSICIQPPGRFGTSKMPTSESSMRTMPVQPRPCSPCTCGRSLRAVRHALRVHFLHCCSHTPTHAPCRAPYLAAKLNVILPSKHRPRARARDLQPAGRGENVASREGNSSTQRLMARVRRRELPWRLQLAR